MGREMEYKYRGSEAAFHALRQRFAPFDAIQMETTYYDTFDLKLAFHQWTLRRRLENGQSVITLKTPLDDGSRGEWEVKSDSLYDGIMALCQEGAPWELMRATAGGVMPLCGARFTRLAAAVTLPDAVVELALDQGVLTGRKKEQPLLELEVEYKQGSEASAAAFARNLATEFGLEAEPLSKFARAMALAMGEGGSL